MSTIVKQRLVSTLSDERRQFTRSCVRTGDSLWNYENHATDLYDCFVNRYEEFLQYRYRKIDCSDPYEE